MEPNDLAEKPSDPPDPESRSISDRLLGAQGVGGPIAAASMRDYRDPGKRQFLQDALVEGMQAWARYAADQGLKFVCWEPAPIGREVLLRLDEAKNLYERLNHNVPIPIHFLLDVGHQCSY